LSERLGIARTDVVWRNHFDASVSRDEKPVQLQRFNDPSAHCADLRSVLRYIGERDGVMDAPVAHALDELTEASSKIEARRACFTLRLNVPAFGRRRVVAQKINVPSVIDGEPELLKMLLDCRLHECFGGELGTARVAASDRHEQLAMPNEPS